MSLFSETIKEIASAIKSSKHLVALTGAGVSTLSGIPDFRTDKSGVWDKYDQSKIFEINYFKRHPEYFYQFAKEYIYKFKNTKPSDAHKLLAHLEKLGYLKSIATQNIDGLHQAAGSKIVYELHGNPNHSFCLECSKKYHQSEVEKILEENEVPICIDCGGIIKPAIVFYGEQLPKYDLNSSIMEAKKCDMMIVMGTSLVVYPAAYLPQEAIENYADVAILTKNPTPFDDFARWVINEDLKRICSELMKYF